MTNRIIFLNVSLFYCYLDKGLPFWLNFRFGGLSIAPKLYEALFILASVECQSSFSQIDS